MTAQRPDRAELVELYKIALDEYRFQVNLNWSRTQYYLVLNFGIFGTGTGILQLAHGNVTILLAAIYFAGAACCGLSLAATQVQHSYYAAARDHKHHIENALRLGSLSIETTPGMGNATITRLGKVKTFNNVLLTVLALMDLIGIVVVLVR